MKSQELRRMNMKKLKKNRFKKKMNTLKISITRAGTLKKENLIYNQYFQDANRLKSI